MCSCQKTCHRAIVRRLAYNSLESWRTRRGEGPCLMAATRTTTAINFPAEKPHGWRRNPLAAPVAIAAKAQAIAMVFR